MLWLLPLALLPLVRFSGTLLPYSCLDLIPRDPFSDILAWALRSIAALVIAAAILGLAGLYRSEVPVERIGKGAQIVVLLDRSRSMDDSFTGGRVNLDPRQPMSEAKRRETKGSIARRLLAEFAAKRQQDMFGWVIFSSRAMRVLEFTQKQEVIQAAIEAGNVGRGLSDTDIAQGLLSALGYFDHQPYSGSRIVMLVSDGGARIDRDTQQQIALLAKRNRVAIYWLYLRSFRSPGLSGEISAADADQQLAPEHFLHKFFQAMGTPYHAYEAEDSESLAKAIQDLNRLENLPLTFTELLPRQDLDRLCYAFALGLGLMLAIAKALEIRAWR